MSVGTNPMPSDNYIFNSAPENMIIFAAFSIYISREAPLTVIFADKNTGSPTCWSWNFGEGNNSTEQNPMHTYSAAGNYTVKLTASNADGMGTNTSEIIVQGAPPKIPGGFNSLIFVMIVSYLCKKSARN